VGVPPHPSSTVLILGSLASTMLKTTMTPML
jgi:hypothetical protein